MPLRSVECQTIWSLPPLDFVQNCPTPTGLFVSSFKTESCVEPDVSTSCQTQAASDHLFTGHLPAKEVTKKRKFHAEDSRTCSLTTNEAVSSSNMEMDADLKPAKVKSGGGKELCQICGDVAAGFHCGAFVCEACKKFYIRACKQPSRSSVCSGRGRKSGGRCEMSKTSRTYCTHCRYQKCIDIGMERPGAGLLDTHSIKSLPCKVCTSPSSGFHFGVLTCEGCKGFFRRLVQEGTSKAEALSCAADGNCYTDIQVGSRSQCRACRYQKCLAVGMSKSAARIGRQPNSVRYARIVENRTTKVEVVDEEVPDVHGVCSQLNPSASSIASPPGNAVVRTSGEETVPSTEQAMDVSASDSQTKFDHPIDLSLPPVVESSMAAAYQVQIEHLAQLFISSSDTYIDTITDEQFTADDLDDAYLVASTVYSQFQSTLRIFIDFSKKIQGFMRLNIDDRVLLTKCGLYRFCLLSCSRRYDLDTGKYYVFGWKGWGEVPKRLAEIFPPYRVFFHHFGTLVRRIKETSLSLEELGLLAVLVTINTDQQIGLKDVETVAKVHSEYMDMLISHITAVAADPTKRLQELNNVLDLLRQAAKEHSIAAKTVIDQYPNYAIAHAQSAQIIPQLYKEMFSCSVWLEQKESTS